MATKANCSTDGKQTYWLYYNGSPIYAVRLTPGASAQEVRCHAVHEHRRIPLCHPELPTTFERKLSLSEVRL